MTLSINRWINLPSSVDPALATNEPLGADVMQVAASSALWGAQVNNLRVLWSHYGANDISGNVAFDDSPASFPWDTDPAAADPVFAAFAGVHRLRPLGAGNTLPNIRVSARMKAPGGNGAGLILVARPAPGGRPSARDAYAVVTTTATSLTTVSALLVPTFTALAARPIAPVTSSTYPPSQPVESGVDTAVALYVGAWKSGTPGAGKVTLAGITVYLEAP